jgi:Fe2+ transport system protein FeoA
MPNRFVTANKIPMGKEAIIREIKGEINFVARLRELGFGESMRISKFSDDAHRTIILNIKGKKMYLSELAAECIWVEVISSSN